jgi:hypothetical protein
MTSSCLSACPGTFGGGKDHEKQGVREDPASFLGFAGTSMEVFEGMLYAGIYTLTTGCRVWRSADGENWAQVNRNGFGNDQNTDATTLAVFGDHLYVATENGHESFGGTETQVWRTDGNTPGIRGIRVFSCGKR